MKEDFKLKNAEISDIKVEAGPGSRDSIWASDDTVDYIERCQNGFIVVMGGEASYYPESRVYEVNYFL